MRWFKRKPRQQQGDRRRLECDDYVWDWSYWLENGEEIVDWGFNFTPYIPSWVDSTEYNRKGDTTTTTVWMKKDYTGTVTGWVKTGYRYQQQDMRIRRGKACDD